MSKIKSKDFGGRWCHFVIVLQKRGWLCHFEGREGYGVSEWCMGNEFRFFTSLRCVQNDRRRDGVFRVTVKGCCVRDDGEGAVRSG